MSELRDPVTVERSELEYVLRLLVDEVGASAVASISGRIPSLDRALWRPIEPAPACEADE